MTTDNLILLKIVNFNLLIMSNIIGMIELISPIMIGDLDDTTKEYSHYFSSGCHPNLVTVANVVVQEIEKSVTAELDRLSLGLPMIDNSRFYFILFLPYFVNDFVS